MDFGRLQPLPAVSGPEPDAHAVEFYDRDFPAGNIARFLADGLESGAAAVVIATVEHRQAILAAFEEGHRVAASAGPERLVFLDAAVTLAEICAGGEPTTAGLRRQVGPLLAELTARCGRIYAYGEMVDLLAGAGRVDSALRLESAWNEVLDQHSAKLLCGYRLGAFDHHGGDGDAFRRVCAAHGAVRIAPEAGSGGPGAIGHERLIAELEQKSRLARLAGERLARLQRITAALAEALTTSQVVEVVGGELAAMMGSEEGELVLPGEDGRSELRRLRSFSRRPGVRCDFGAVAVDAPLPTAEAYRRGKPIWLPTRRAIEERFGHAHQPSTRAAAALPVAAGGRVLGAIGLGYSEERDFSAADRDVAADVARQVGVALDRARLYEDAQAAREEAERASNAKDEFLAMLGHELRNPLSPIVTALHLMRLRGSGELERERVLIERQVSHLLRLVEDLLDVSRITRGKVQLERKPVELAEVVAQAIEMVGPLVAQRAHRLSIDVPPEGLRVEGDAARLAQVVSNLLMNAAKYTPGGGRIEVSAGSEGTEAFVKVRDNGMGIAPDLLPSVFDLFVQGPRARDRADGGLGLGLAIVHSLVELHGGRVAVASGGIGRGAEFTVRLPLARAAAPEDEAMAALRANGRGLRVLLVDDNVDAALTLAELLAAMGCETRVAHDGPAALVAAQDFAPRLVLLDIGLPVMDGYELAARLRRNGLDHAFVAALTGYGQPEDRERSRRAGFDDHFVKPMAPETLRVLVASLASAPSAEGA